jgi:hypothetical protein
MLLLFENLNFRSFVFHLEIEYIYSVNFRPDIIFLVSVMWDFRNGTYWLVIQVSRSGESITEMWPKTNVKIGMKYRKTKKKKRNKSLW